MSDSYTSDNQGIADQFRQITSLRRRYSQNLESLAAKAVAEVKEAEARILREYGVQLTGLDILELGPGQLLGQLPYFSKKNRVSAADRDIIAQGFSPIVYVRMLRNNGLVRTFKTVGRKVLGVDRKYLQELCRILGVQSLPFFSIAHASADRLSSPNRSFDLVYARAVFQHLPAPADAIKEIIRVLRPGGIAYISLQPYTSPTGCLDPRALYGSINNELGLWPHLRPELKDRIKPNAYANELGLRDWQRIFSEETRGPVFFLTSADAEYFPLAETLKKAGHLQDYPTDELTTGALDVMFRKPGPQDR